ncbi:class I SAM-dependent methyltransferase [Paraburkholderia sacchari]|uniref:Class I SAM-dependent methyltransferase n=1 Tax=Paraburkholderia sacchari TaxID=159450 RepID=A0A8T6ZBJ4_9BURK|nr:methyltransferase domain-containing protein [Paraburkholderia sacchari]NLP61670.1 class I SAM-dependent methyltransferase [Paraburkholderia sacchari]
MFDAEPIHGKGSFIRALPRSGRVLDVGCGNGSPAFFRSMRPDIYYVGVDVDDCNQPGDPSEHADEYVVCPPKEFAATLESYAGQMDAVVSTHNLEHCDEPERVIDAMVSALRPGGRLYLAFPCEESVHFPKRAGCLNFFDDRTHQRVPSWRSTLEALSARGCEFEFKAKRYRPCPLWIRGLLFEPVSMLRRQVIPGATWALYGFESVIWVRKPALPVVLGNWGPQEARVGEGVNIQPSGESAIWIQAQNVTGFGETWVEFGEYRAVAPAMVYPDVITTSVPNIILDNAGDYQVSIVESSGRRTAVGTLVVTDR